VNDTCGDYGKSSCQCDYDNCQHLSVAAGIAVGVSSHVAGLGVDAIADTVVGLGYQGCFSPLSDAYRTLAEVPGVNLLSSAPDSCGGSSPPSSPPSTPAPAPVPEDTLKILAAVQVAISDRNRIQAAVNAFVGAQAELRNVIDVKTGTMLANHFSLSPILASAPNIRVDGSLDLEVLVNFQPLENILTPSGDHLRVFCPCVQSFLATLTGLNVSDASDCQWGDIFGNSKKRAVLQTTSGSQNTYTSSANFPSESVQSNYGTKKSEAHTLFSREYVFVMVVTFTFFFLWFG